MKRQKPIRYLTVAAAIAALYCALTLLLPFITFGTVQCRLSEALTVLPVFTPAAIPGLIVGCLLSNAVGMATGANVAGGWDILVGTFATAAAALLTRRLRHIRIKNLPLLATIPPVLINGLLIGGELTFVLFGGFKAEILLLNVLSVTVGQLCSCTLLGLLLYTAVQKSNLLQNF